MLTETAPHNGLTFDHWQFEDSRQRIASARTGLDWKDIGNIQVVHHKQSGERRLPTPVWALNDRLLRELLVAFLESRVGIHKPTGTLSERRKRAEEAVLRARPRMNATLDKLNLEYVQATRENASRERLNELEQEIEGLDTYLRYTHDGGLATIASIVYLYHRLNLDSVGVADQLTLKPPHVRQLLWRLNGIWTEKFGGEAVPRRKIKRWGPFDHQRAAELRLTGMPYTEIARQLNARPHAVKGVLDKMGIKAPPKPQRVKVEHKPMHRIDTKRAAELRATGMTWREVADAIGNKHSGAILSAMKRAGLFIRSNKVCVRKQKGQALSPDL